MKACAEYSVVPGDTEMMTRVIGDGAKGNDSGQIWPRAAKEIGKGFCIWKAWSDLCFRNTVLRTVIKRGRLGTQDLDQLLGPGKSGKSLDDGRVRWFLEEHSDIEELIKEGYRLAWRLRRQYDFQGLGFCEGNAGEKWLWGGEEESEHWAQFWAWRVQGYAMHPQGHSV